MTALQSFFEEGSVRDLINRWQLPSELALLEDYLPADRDDQPEDHLLQMLQEGVFRIADDLDLGPFVLGPQDLSIFQQMSEGYSSLASVA